MFEHVTKAAIGIAVVGSLVCAPVAANAVEIGARATSDVVASNARGNWSSADWREVAERSRAAGDLDGAAAAEAMADRADRGEGPDLGQRNIWTSIAKKAVIQVLRYSVDKLPKKIRPYASKIIKVVDEIDNFQEKAVVAALIHVGIPADVAAATAQWIVIFVGL